MAETGGQIPYSEVQKRHTENRSAPVHWSWKSLSDALATADHTPYGTLLTLTSPDGDHQIVPGTSMTFQVVRPCQRTKAHAHAWWHLFFARSGTGSVVFDEIDDATTLNKGDILLIPAWRIHYFVNEAMHDDFVLLNMSNLPQQAALGNLLSEEKV